jgi:cell division transport system permease protein
MSLNLYYSFREGIKGLRRARLASIVTVTTIAVTLILLDFFMILTVNVNRVIRSFKAQMVLEVFMDDTLDSLAVENLKRDLRQIDGIESVIYVSPEQALERFTKEFGEDPLTLLGENPLPCSFQILLKPGYRTPDSADAIAVKIQQNQLVDEVVYHGRFYRMFENYSKIVLFLDLGLVIIVFSAALLLVANTIRLTILAQSKSIQIMRLIGATQAFIRRPYLIQGIFQGSLGGCFCSLAVWCVVKLIAWKFSLHPKGMPFFFWGPILFGGLLGFLGSLLGLRRYLNT